LRSLQQALFAARRIVRTEHRRKLPRLLRRGPLQIRIFQVVKVPTELAVEDAGLGLLGEGAGEQVGGAQAGDAVLVRRPAVQPGGRTGTPGPPRSAAGCSRAPPRKSG